MSKIWTSLASVLLTAVTTFATTFSFTNQWPGGGQGLFRITNDTAQNIQGWTLEFDWAADITSAWNGTIQSHVGNHYKIINADYNATITPGGFVEVGCAANFAVAGVLPTAITVNGISGGGTGGGTTGGGTTIVPSIVIDDAAITLASVSSGSSTAAGYFSTSGNQIIDANGNPVRITGVNWFGFETSNKVFHGLWTRGYKSVLDQVKSLGFNTLRIPYCNEMLAAGATTNSINFAQNPDLQGLTPLQCMDKVVDYCGQIGLRVFLDRHSAKADNFIGEDVWYIPGDAYYTESRWISDWVMLAQHYAGNSTVIGADLFNEPKKSATWGNSAPATDWNKAAERCGNAVLAANPNWLIIVEGVEKYNNQTTWWGGNLTGAAAFPVVLSVNNKLVYSPHEYPSTVFAQTWFSDATYPNNMDDVWNSHWGYIYKNNVAPILIGEFGSKLATTSDQVWLDKLTDYMNGDLDLNGTNDLAAGKLGMSWTYWCMNPNSGDTGGILNDDWTTVSTAKMAYLQASLAPSLGAGSAGAAPQYMNFPVTLSAAATGAVTVAYATTNGTAIAGTNYTTASGTLSFAAGEKVKAITVAIPNQAATTAKQFTVQLSSVVGATLADASAIGTLLSTALPSAPVITSASTASASVGIAFEYQITASGSATSFSALGLPSGLSVNTASGLISGTPTTAAVSAITIRATNTGGTGSALLSLTVTQPAQCVGDGNLDGILDSADISLVLLDWGGPSDSDFNGDGSTDSGDISYILLSWGPCDAGTSGAGGGTGTGGGTDTGSGTGGAVAPVVTSSASAAGTVGSAFSYQITASGTPTSFGATSLPAGLSVNATSGLISGTPTVAATSNVLLSASNATGTATQSLALTISPASVPGTFNYAEVLQKSLYFYDAQRSGNVATDFRVPWRGDSALTDGSDVGIDLTGGYYDAGDHVKFGLPMASSLSLLAWGGIEYGAAYDKTGQKLALLAAVRWGTDFIIKAHPSANVLYGQVGNGSLDHSYWGPSETMNMARPAYAITAAKPGSDLAGESAAAMAAASMLFRSSDAAYADTLLAHARTLFTFADTYRGKYSDSITDAASYYNSWSGYYDELAWSAAWLYRATGEAAYLTKAESIYSQNISGLPLKWTHNWDDKTYGVTVLLAQLTGKSVYKTAAEKWLNFWTVGDNGSKIAYTAGGLAWLDQWGSLRYSANTSFLALVYADRIGDVGTRYRDFARNQIDYMLGKNPNARSYVVGFGVNPPVNPHHRGAHGSWNGSMTTPVASRHILYGALVGGPSTTSDSSYSDDRSNYVCNEVALDYNAGFTGAVARLAQDSTGVAVSNFPPASESGSIDDEFFVEASINQQGTGFTEIRALLNNRSAFPAVGSSAFSMRYFVDLSELFAAGYDQTSVVVSGNYIQNGTVATALKVYDAARKLYYVDVSFAGTFIAPGTGSSYWREAQFRMALKTGVPATAWSAANDPSFAGLGVGNTNMIQTSKIAVYDNGQKITGVLP